MVSKVGNNIMTEGEVMVRLLLNSTMAEGNS